MRHRKDNPKLGRTSADQRKALLRSLITALFTHEKITTTITRAKAVQPLVDHMISQIGKMSKVIAIREIKKTVYTVEASKKAFDIAEKLKDRKSGFTKIIPVEYRQGDAAKIVQIEFVNN